MNAFVQNERKTWLLLATSALYVPEPKEERKANLLHPAEHKKEQQGDEGTETE